jgi:hypothetical protein
MRVLMSCTWVWFLAIGTMGAVQNVSSEDDFELTKSSPKKEITQVQARWEGPDGAPLPFTDEEELLEFLRTADVVAKKELSSGKNRPLKVRLEKDGVEANAIFRTVHKTATHARIYGKIYRDFRDSYANEGAAYELSRLLGIDNVPPCVSRTLDRKEGTLQLWVENAETLTDHIQRGNGATLNRYREQRQMMQVFDALIHNFDRNTGNILFDARGKLWFIDHTRSFLVTGRVEGIDKIYSCERTMWEKLRALDGDLLKAHLRPYLDYLQMATLLDRRDKIVIHLQELIEQVGEQAVLFEAGGIRTSLLMR